MKGRCAGLSYNAWTWLMPTRIVEELIDQKMLRCCSNHPNKLVLTRRAADLEGRWLQEGGRDGSQGGTDLASADAASG